MIQIPIINPPFFNVSDMEHFDCYSLNIWKFILVMVGANFPYFIAHIGSRARDIY